MSEKAENEVEEKQEPEQPLAPLPTQYRSIASFVNDKRFSNVQIKSSTNEGVVYQ